MGAETNSQWAAMASGTGKIATEPIIGRRANGHPALCPDRFTLVVDRRRLERGAGLSLLGSVGTPQPRNRALRELVTA